VLPSPAKGSSTTCGPSGRSGLDEPRRQRCGKHRRMLEPQFFGRLAQITPRRKSSSGSSACHRGCCSAWARGGWLIRGWRPIRVRDSPRRHRRVSRPWACRVVRSALRASPDTHRGRARSAVLRSFSRFSGMSEIGKLRPRFRYRASRGEKVWLTPFLKRSPSGAHKQSCRW